MNCTEVTPVCPVEATLYSYRPNAGGNGFFTAAFTILFITQVVSVCCLRVRTWTYMINLAIGTGFEVVGYVARLKMNSNPWSSTGTSAQLVTLVVGPSFIAAAVSVTFKQIVIYCGAEYSLLRPRLIPFIMVGTDFVCIFVQFVGASILAKASNEDDQSAFDLGDSILIAGIAIQVATMMGCGALMVLFAHRKRRAHKIYGNRAPVELLHLSTHQQDLQTDRAASDRFQQFCWAMAVAYTTILVRCIYRYR